MIRRWDVQLTVNKENKWKLKKLKIMEFMQSFEHLVWNIAIGHSIQTLAIFPQKILTTILFYNDQMTSLIYRK